MRVTSRVAYGAVIDQKMACAQATAIRAAISMVKLVASPEPICPAVNRARTASRSRFGFMWHTASISGIKYFKGIGGSIKVSFCCY